MHIYMLISFSSLVGYMYHLLQYVFLSFLAVHVAKLSSWSAGGVFRPITTQRGAPPGRHQLAPETARICKLPWTPTGLNNWLVNWLVTTCHCLDENTNGVKFFSFMMVNMNMWIIVGGGLLPSRKTMAAQGIWKCSTFWCGCKPMREWQSLEQVEHTTQCQSS